MLQDSLYKEKIEVNSIPIPESGCWIWLGALTREYPTTCAYGKQTYAHRLSWEVHNRKLVKGEVIRHKCHQPMCVNPQHLTVGTAQDNANDGLLKNAWHNKLGVKNIFKRGNRYIVKVKTYHLGGFKTLEEAVKARDEFLACPAG